MLHAQSIADDLAKYLAAEVGSIPADGLVEQIHAEAPEADGLHNAVARVAHYIKSEGKKIAPFRPPVIGDTPEWRGKCGDVELRLLFHSFAFSPPVWRVDVFYA